MTELVWTPLPDAEAVARLACERILAAARDAIDARGRFIMVLAGGGTPQRAYARLSQATSDWQNWHIYFGDERCLPEDDPGRNSHTASQSLLSHVPIPSGNVHSIPAELGADAAAMVYRETVKAAMPFDLVLLGIGEDGHTASIFPKQEPASAPVVYAVHNAPKPPPERVTLSSDALGNCRRLLFLVTGAGKHEVVSRWRKGDRQLPVTRIPVPGNAEVLIDAAASGG